MGMQTKIYVVDEMMGRGKTSAAINHINNAPSKKKFLYITPFISEVERIKGCCKKKDFKEPSEKKYGSKLRSIKYLLSDRSNIVSTHALFNMFDEDCISVCAKNDYSLILDEVADVVSQYDVTNEDFHTLLKEYVDVDEMGFMHWRKSKADYTGKFYQEKILCQKGCMICYNDKILLWMLPVDVFVAFKEIYILTYMFDCQIQRYYYDLFGVEYSYLYVRGGDTGQYKFSDVKVEATNIVDYRKLIHICDDNKLNFIGFETTALSKSWYNKNTKLIPDLKRNVYNFFRNKCGSDSKDNIWTTFSGYRALLKGKGYAKGFLAINCRATNEYRNRTCIAYCANRYVHTYIYRFFEGRGIVMDQDGFALSEMLQFIWRSAVRDKKEIWVYIPSRRMRNLLEGWIEKVSVGEVNNEQRI